MSFRGASNHRLVASHGSEELSRPTVLPSSRRSPRAGTPSEGAPRGLVCWVNPRAGGEAFIRLRPGACSSGLSPAQAGKPRPRIRSAPSPRVDPRAGGEASGGSFGLIFRPGPSPRRRGSHFGARRRPPPQGSIPAQAGKPQAPSRRRSKTRVDPRAGGEAISMRTLADGRKGRSPRRRGSLFRAPLAK